MRPTIGQPYPCTQYVQLEDTCHPVLSCLNTYTIGFSVFLSKQFIGGAVIGTLFNGFPSNRGTWMVGVFGNVQVGARRLPFFNTANSRSRRLETRNQSL